MNSFIPSASNKEYPLKNAACDQPTIGSAFILWHLFKVNSSAIQIQFQINSHLIKAKFELKLNSN